MSAATRGRKSSSGETTKLDKSMLSRAHSVEVDVLADVLASERVAGTPIADQLKPRRNSRVHALNTPITSVIRRRFSSL
jgi:hypothetical protein